MKTKRRFITIYRRIIIRNTTDHRAEYQRVGFFYPEVAINLFRYQQPSKKELKQALAKGKNIIVR
ncbi:hypothetical protein [Pseudogracilibacillus auburnensis]|uniref:hypothetical protein n=1 Tax=Pseudogracilibacillus auburnensis TaxID=1494959 RepID=UPI001A9677C3|nr:hypothetical protein [Pseudogracilibacillus auburnensis]MBO1003720.1 hypothetical protein [Pseudogracilibacillus auburnensis]